MSEHPRGGRTPTIRRLGFWALIGLVFLGLTIGFERIRGSAAQPAAPAADAAPAPAPAAATSAPAAPAAKPPCVDAPKKSGPSKFKIGSRAQPGWPPELANYIDTLARTPKPFYQELIPIGILIAVIVLVVSRLPKSAIDHSPAFRRRRVLNWLPLGLTYAFLYMGRYNMTVLKDVGALSGADYGDVAFWGALTYGVSFLLNGPLADQIELLNRQGIAGGL